MEMGSSRGCSEDECVFEVIRYGNTRNGIVGDLQFLSSVSRIGMATMGEWSISVGVGWEDMEVKQL